MKWIFFKVFCVATLGLPAIAHAQVGSTTDILTGKVTGPDGQPVVGARVDVMSIELQTTRGRTTNDKGIYTLLFPDGGGQYRVTVKAIGFAPFSQTLIRQADEDRLELNAKLSKNTTTLAAFNVNARQPVPNANDRPTPGSTERNLTAEQLYRLPIDPSDIAALAGLAPGVVTLSATDSSSSAFSVAGQRTDQNQITLDGMSFGSGGVPSEAVRNTRVITNTFDVARGQFTGGQVASTTRGGTNAIQGSVGYLVNEPDLQFDDSSTTESGQKFTSNQLSFGLGGPIARDAAFWFGSASARFNSTGLQSLLTANDQILLRNNVAPDSAARFLSLLQGYGVPTVTALVPAGHNTDSFNALTREDFAIGDRHTLTLRGDWNFARQDVTRTSSLAVPSHGGNLRSLGGGFLVSISSTFDSGIINEGRIYASTTNGNQNAFLIMPEGRVRVSSILNDNSLGISTLTFGGNGGLPYDNTTKQLEFSDEISYLKGGSLHRPKIGVLLNIGTFDQTASSNLFGSFTFNSLSDFAANIPSQYTRTLEPTRRQGDVANAALYIGDTWRVTRGFQTTYGVRAEGTRFDGRPAYNPTVDSLFNRRTDNFPSEVHASPRIGFTWTSNVPPARVQNDSTRPADAARQLAATASGQPDGGGGRGGRGGGGGNPGGVGGGANFFAGQSSWIVRGGIGEFRGKAPTGLFTSALGATGLSGAESQLVCIGPATPVANWAAYLADPNSIPSACADGGNAAASIFAATKRNVTTFAPDFGAPRSWRGSLGVQHHLFGRYTGSLDASYTLGKNLYGVGDLNLKSTPQFTIAAEGNRPIYVSPAAIVPTTGAVQSLQARVAPQFGNVYNVFSGLQSKTGQIVASLNGFNSLGMQVSFSYTYSRSMDQSSFSGGSAAGGFSSPTTAGNPNVTEWGTSDLQRMHTFVTMASWPITPSLELTGVLRYNSGAPYTPRVNGDINGDGARNDRAFIYDPAHVPDTTIANGMTRLIDHAPAHIRACLVSQLGQIAGRNSCTAGWQPNLSLQLNYRPDHFGLKRNLMISASLLNPLAGLDIALHGVNNLQGWGQTNRVDNQLLYVTGFDPSTNRFLYQVNERFGDQRSTTTTVIQQPFQVSLTARYTIGPDRAREALLAAQGAARGGRGGAPTGPGGAVAGMVRRYAPNIFKDIIDRADTLKLGLNDSQKSLLKILSDSMTKQIDTLSVHLEDRVKKAGNNVDQAALTAYLRPVLAEAQDLGAKAVREALIILTKEQWAKLPERMKNPMAVFGGPGGARGGGRGGPPN